MAGEGFLIFRHNEIEYRLVYQIFSCHFEHIRGGTIGLDNRPAGVCGQIGNRGEVIEIGIAAVRFPEFILRVPQSLFPAYTLGNILIDTGHPDGFAVRVPYDHAVSLHILDGPVGMDDTEGGIEGLSLGKGGIAFLDRPLPVIGMKSSHPGIERAREGVAGNPIECKHPVVPDQDILLHLPVPDAEICRKDCKSEPLRIFSQPRLGIFLRGDVTEGNEIDAIAILNGGSLHPRPEWGIIRSHEP